MKNLAFKKIPASQTIYTEQGYATNKIYIFSVDWLNSVACKTNKQLRNRVLKAQLKDVELKLKGYSQTQLGINNVVELVDLKEFRPVNLNAESVKPIRGHKNGTDSKLSTVAYKLGNKACIDVEFFAALQWDLNATVRARDEKSPIVIEKGGVIVGMIAPILINK